MRKPIEKAGPVAASRVEGTKSAEALLPIA